MKWSKEYKEPKQPRRWSHPTPNKPFKWPRIKSFPEVRLNGSTITWANLEWNTSPSHHEKSWVQDCAKDCSVWDMEVWTLRWAIETKVSLYNPRKSMDKDCAIMPIREAREILKAKSIVIYMLITNILKAETLGKLLTKLKSYRFLM